MQANATIAIRDLLRQQTAHSWLRALAIGIPAAAALALLTFKFLMVGRHNINWDEFWFLKHVHEAARGELTLFLQGAYVHLFRWLTWLQADEAGQIITARALMAVLLTLTAILMWRLAAIWTSTQAALLAPLAYLATSPVLQHGASFRADSMLAPLTVATLLLLATRPAGRRSIIGAGVLLGVAVAISIKTILVAPALAGLVLLTKDANGRKPLADSVKTLALAAAVSVATAAILFVTHRASLAPGDVAATTDAARVLGRTILEAPFLPRRQDYVAITVANQFVWQLMVVGAVCAVLRPRFWPAAACALSLLPILFYRNAWSYYYIVMLAPACVLVAVAGENLRQLVRRLSPSAAPELAVIAIAAWLGWNAADHVEWQWRDRQHQQRAVIAAVHRVFPTPVSYIDHSGMIASFPKVNFFMSTWGLEEYRARGASFMEDALRKHPPLLLVNRPVLDPTKGAFKLRLLPRDRELIEKFYQPYWGPIRIAGVSVELAEGGETSAELPFPGRYRLESERAVVIDGRLTNPGEVLDIGASSVRLRPAADAGADASALTMVKLIDARAEPPPTQTPPGDELYTSLIL